MPQTFEVHATFPQYDGPFILEVPAQSPAAAMRRAMWSLIAAGHFDPPVDMSPDDVLAAYFRVVDPLDTCQHCNSRTAGATVRATADEDSYRICDHCLCIGAASTRDVDLDSDLHA